MTAIMATSFCLQEVDGSPIKFTAAFLKVHSSGGLLSSSRTLSVEVDVNNVAHILKSGLFVNVTFAVPREHPSIVIPAEALIFNRQGLRVAAVNQDKSIHLQPLTVYRDSGATIELSDGLRAGENIVLNPPTSLQEGGKVKVTSEQKVADTKG
jgi:multidrug efflux pump subunit AcrA (membrane-fusion protein)